MNKITESTFPGFANLSANCWINSFLQMILSVDTLKQAYITVAEHYANDTQNPPNQEQGKALLNVFQEYETAKKENRAIPSEVSQNVRLAFHHFFGKKNALTQHEIFSPYPHAQEDANEALQCLMGRYEEILRNRQKPLSYTSMCTRRLYQPHSQAENPQVGKDYSVLSADHCSKIENLDYQILIDLQNKGHLLFSSLLKKYFQDDQVQNSDLATYLRADGKVQQFKLIGESREFSQPPKELFLTLKLFATLPNASLVKISTPIQVERTLTLPPTATAQYTPITYTLDHFIVHSGSYGGGHYIAYKKIDNQWIECNDSVIRFLSEHEIDQILCRDKKGDFSSYLHHYVRQQLPLSISCLSIEQLEKEIEMSQQSITLLEQSLFPDVLKNLSLPLLQKLRYAIWLNDKTPQDYDYGTKMLEAEPQKVKEIQLPWIFSSHRNLLEQLLAMQKRKLSIAIQRLRAIQLDRFLQQLNNPTVTKEELAKTWNTLPQKEVQWAVHGLLYQSHKIKYGEDHVHNPSYEGKYGHVVLDKGDMRELLLNAKEYVLNLSGSNIISQLAAFFEKSAEKLQSIYEREQWESFHFLLSSPELINEQLVYAFYGLDMSEASRNHFYRLIGSTLGQSNTYAAGKELIEKTPRRLLSLKNSTLCTEGSNLLLQLIHLLKNP